jgi:hypothetical protein
MLSANNSRHFEVLEATASRLIAIVLLAATHVTIKKFRPIPPKQENRFSAAQTSLLQFALALLERARPANDLFRF